MFSFFKTGKNFRKKNSFSPQTFARNESTELNQNYDKSNKVASAAYPIKSENALVRKAENL
jgi:hypothetical protein